MNKLGLIVLGCTLGVAACSHLREPNDEQLSTLLQREGATAADAKASIDANAVGCLRAWSDVPELTRGLPVRIAGEDGRKTCRTRIDGWIADAARNPDKFGFAELSAPDTVRRAMALLDAHAAIASAPGARGVPKELKPAVIAPRPLPVPDPTVDLGAPGVELREAETLCQQTEAASAAADANRNLKRFASSCGRTLRRLRQSMETSAKSGRTPEKLEPLAITARNMANNARDLLAAAK
jgi:hypothetical protein